MIDIFLSYASEDRERVRPLVEALLEHGWSVWWDRDIPPGMTWPQLIEQALSDTRAMVVVWTAASVVSEWVQIEAAEGKGRGGFVPVSLDDITPPLQFRLVQSATLVGWDGSTDDPQFRAAVAQLEATLGVPERALEARAKLEQDEKAAAREHGSVTPAATSTALAPTATATASKHPGLIVQLAEWGFERSPRSERLFYHPGSDSMRVAFTSKRVRLEKRTRSGHWARLESWTLSDLETARSQILKALNLEGLRVGQEPGTSKTPRGGDSPRSPTDMPLRPSWVDRRGGMLRGLWWSLPGALGMIPVVVAEGDFVLVFFGLVLGAGGAISGAITEGTEGAARVARATWALTALLGTVIALVLLREDLGPSIAIGVVEFGALGLVLGGILGVRLNR